MKRFILFSTVFAIFITTFGTKMAAQSLTLQRVIDGGIKNNKTLLADKSKIEAAAARYDATYSNLYPSVKLSGGYTRQSYVEPFGIASKDPATGQPITLKFGEAIENITQFRAGVQQTIYAGGRTRYAVESAKLLTDAARLEVEKDKAEVQMNLINTFYMVYKLQVTQSLLADNKKAAERRLKDVEELVKNGMALPNDALRAQLQLQQIEQTDLELGNNKAAALYTLGLQTGEIVDANTTIDTVTVWNKNSEDLIRAAAMKPIEGYISIGIASRIELKTTQTRLKTAENSVNIAKGALLPTVAVGANYVYANPNQRYFPQKNEFNGSWDAGLTVAFDLTNAFTNKFSVNEASSNLAMQKGLADVQREGVQTEIVAAYYNLQSGISKIEANRKAVIQATENYRVTTNKYTQQTATISELLDADVLLLQTKINLATAKADAENSYYKLSKVTGVF